MRRLLCALVAIGAVLPATAHDTWFVPQASAPRGEAVLALGTGTQFPALEFPVALQQVQVTGCRGDGVRAESLRWVADTPAALLLRTARPVPATTSLTCWAQLVPIDIEIDDPTVDIYLAEIQAPPAVRERWAALKARGVRWRETYVKHARIEIDRAAAPAAGPAEPVGGLGLDVLLDSPQRPARVGDTLRFQVLRDGQPLAGLPVELRSDLSPVGLWRTTDAEGRVQIALPLAARWILRGTDLRLSAARDDAWESRFVTLAFEVAPK